MKLHLQQSEQQNLITAYDEKSISVNHQSYAQNIALSAEQMYLDWCEAGWESIEGQHFELLLAFKPEVVLLGTGKQHRFIHPKHIQALTAQHIAVECMSTAAACRTYNILVAEGRQVVAALLLD
jgi:uncharacterized protein